MSRFKIGDIVRVSKKFRILWGRSWGGNKDNMIVECVWGGHTVQTNLGYNYIDSELKLVRRPK